MNQLFILFTTLFVFTSCMPERKDKTNHSGPETRLQVIEKKNLAEIPTDIITYFDEFTGDSMQVEVENYTHERNFKPSECLPLSFLPVFDHKIPQTQSASTGAKPVGKLKMDNHHYFLVVVQQDDYGPIYYGLLYDKQKNKIEKSEKIAETWGDAGDSQVTYSVIQFMNKTVIIKKYIETCHADLELNEDEKMASEIDCADSTSTIRMEIKSQQ